MYVCLCFKNTCNHETVTFNEALLAKAVTYATLHNYVGLVTHNSFVLQNQSNIQGVHEILCFSLIFF